MLLASAGFGDPDGQVDTGDLLAIVGYLTGVVLLLMLAVACKNC